jgi:hypothetical protein
MHGVETANYHVIHIHSFHHPRRIFMRRHPMTWTAVHLALASAATWFLLESGALTSTVLFSLH